MSRAELRVTGADRLVSTLHTAAVELDRLDRPARDAGRLVQQRAVDRAPRRTGQLVGSVVVDVDGDTAEISSTVAHAGPLNYGVGPRRGLRGPHNIRATRWLTGALDDQAGRVVTIYGRHTTTALRKVKGA